MTTRPRWTAETLAAGTPGQRLLAHHLWHQSRPWWASPMPLPPVRCLRGRSRWERRFLQAVQRVLLEAMTTGPLAHRRGFCSAAALPLPLELAWTTLGLLPAAARHPVVHAHLPFFRPTPVEAIPTDPSANLLWGARQCPSLFPFLLS